MVKWQSKKVINEAEDYLKATDAVSRPVAILMTLAAIILVAALVFTLFLGGRWVYNRVHKSNEGDKVQVDKPNNQPPAVPSGSDNTVSSDTTDKTPPITTSETAASTNNPSTIPNTGPGGLEILVTVAGIGYISHIAFTKLAQKKR